MVIWSGYGWVPIVVLLAIAFGLYSAAGGTESSWPLGVAFLLTAVLTFGFGWWLRQRVPSMIDPQTGRAARKGHGHTLFFVPLEYASIGFVALGIAGFFVEPKPRVPDEVDVPAIQTGPDGRPLQ